MEKQATNDEFVIAEASGLTLQDEALLEAGKHLLLNSVDDARNYCKQMINVAIGAIPIYLSILKLWVPQPQVTLFQSKAFMSAPAFLFLLAALSFSLGYLPLRYEMNIDNIDSIEKVRSQLMSYRGKFGTFGFLLFCLGVVLAVMSVIFGKL